MSEGTKIAIVGAGRLGSTLARTRAASGLARRMVENFCRWTGMSCHARDMAVLTVPTLEGRYGIEGVRLSLPVVIVRSDVRTGIPVPLSDKETSSLVNSAAAIRALFANDVGSPKG
jgi:malate/lactate dehydrogenase